MTRRTDGLLNHHVLDEHTAPQYAVGVLGVCGPRL